MENSRSKGTFCLTAIQQYLKHICDPYFGIKVKPLAAAFTNAMGTTESISDAPQRNNGPKQSHQEQYSLMQWAHWSALAEPRRKIMGQSKAIRSSIPQCDGPTRVHRQSLPEK